ncbi:MAG: multicopper oxidase family protein [Bradyrhizobium sp.]|nr:multicopper oxidase family protein [Bradyrhizobium sp.]
MTLPPLTRRSVLGGVAGLAATLGLDRTALADASTKRLTLVAAPGRSLIAGSSYPETPVWCFSGQVPGPEIRVRQGERVHVRVENRLPEATTVHWHGLRIPNAMDGVPHLTQKPIEPGDTFEYEFACRDAGTFWYHPHQRSHEQVERGLAGAFIVEEASPMSVDRELTWVLDDWRLMRDASISSDFGNMHDAGHDGRIGNTVTINGQVRDAIPVRAGERIRLRLINAANARIFGLVFKDHAPQIVALDGQPVEPHAPDGGRIVLGPAMRADIVLDMAGRPGARFQVVDTFYRGLENRLVDLAYSEEPSLLPSKTSEPVPRLPANPLPEPDLARARRHKIVLGGGMMGMMRSAVMDGRTVDMRTLMQNGLLWAINGVAAKGHVHEPLLTLERNSSCVLELVNDTAWPHPIHLHGHSFRVVSRNGAPTRHREWLDTVLLHRGERAEIAFVADNPGDWMFHCHILEHQAAGMMGVIRVS